MRVLLTKSLGLPVSHLLLDVEMLVFEYLPDH